MTKRALLIAVIAAIAAITYWSFFGQEEPIAEAPTGNGAMVQVTVPMLMGTAIIGEQIFNAKCAACHGENAAGRQGSGPPLVHKIYEPSHHGDMAFMLAPKRGVQSHHWPFGNMPPIEGLTDGDIKQVITYVRTLQQANGIN
ncbi:MAG: cytochrome c [Paracoccaceae bacterium]|jgi:mono/diheme cytochrome c family protein|nr:cytochrome c [Paracoccaceae bacterium]